MISTRHFIHVDSMASSKFKFACFLNLRLVEFTDAVPRFMEGQLYLTLLEGPQRRLSLENTGLGLKSSGQLTRPFKSTVGRAFKSTVGKKIKNNINK